MVDDTARNNDEAAEAAVAKIEEEFGAEADNEVPPAEVPEPVEPDPVAVSAVPIDGIVGSMALEAIPVVALKPAKGFRKVDTDEPEFIELVASIKKNGIINPLTAVGTKIISGRRRLEAAKSLGLKEVPVIVTESDEAGQALVSLIANVQRKNLNGIEEAKAYQQLIEKGVVTSQKELAGILGISESRLSQKLSVLGLTGKVKKAVTLGRISTDAALQLKDADKACVDMLLDEAQDTGKPVTEPEAKAATGPQLIKVPLSEDVPKEITGIKVSENGVQVTLHIAKTTKKWKDGEFGGMLESLGKETAKTTVDVALTNARKEID